MKVYIYIVYRKHLLDYPSDFFYCNSVGFLFNCPKITFITLTERLLNREQLRSWADFRAGTREESIKLITLKRDKCNSCRRHTRLVTVWIYAS